MYQNVYIGQFIKNTGLHQVPTFFKILIFCNICKGFNNLCVSTELSQYRGHILVQETTNYTVCRFIHLKQNQFHKSRSHLKSFCHTMLVKCADLCASQSYYDKRTSLHLFTQVVQDELGSLSVTKSMERILTETRTVSSNALTL